MTAWGDHDEASLNAILDMMATDQPHGLRWSGVARLFRRKLSALRASVGPQEGWQPMSTAPRSLKCFFWVVPKDADECPTNTSGVPITAVGHEPHRIEGCWGWWGSLWKPIAWMPLPAGPASLPEGQKGDL